VLPRFAEGKVVKNRLHLDVRVGTGLVGEERLAAPEAECARLVALGAVRTFASRLVQFAITRVAVPRRANGPDKNHPSVSTSTNLAAIGANIRLLCRWSLGASANA
jgi:hypothetical protein